MKLFINTICLLPNSNWCLWSKSFLDISTHITNLYSMALLWQGKGILDLDTQSGTFHLLIQTCWDSILSILVNDSILSVSQCKAGSIHKRIFSHTITDPTRSLIYSDPQLHTKSTTSSPKLLLFLTSWLLSLPPKLVLAFPLTMLDISTGFKAFL